MLDLTLYIESVIKSRNMFPIKNMSKILFLRIKFLIVFFFSFFVRTNKYLRKFCLKITPSNAPFHRETKKSQPTKHRL